MLILNFWMFCLSFLYQITLAFVYFSKLSNVYMYRHIMYYAICFVTKNIQFLFFSVDVLFSLLVVQFSVLIIRHDILGNWATISSLLLMQTHCRAARIFNICLVYRCYTSVHDEQHKKLLRVDYNIRRCQSIS